MSPNKLKPNETLPVYQMGKANVINTIKLLFSGDLVDEIHQTYSNWTTQVIRIYKEETHAEFDWLMGPPIHIGS